MGGGCNQCGGSQTANSTGSQAGKEASGGRKYVDYRLDPAPSWTGDQPEKHYKEYIRNLQLWLVEAEARLPRNLIGKRIIDSIPIGSKLSSLMAHLTVEEICAEQGHKTIVGIIEMLTNTSETNAWRRPSTTRSSKAAEREVKP